MFDKRKRKIMKHLSCPGAPEVQGNVSRHCQGIESWEALAWEAKFHPAKMAELCLISLRQIERFFAQHFKKTPREWTRELRCQMAVQLISKGWSSKAVAIELDFA